jgi:hypothetical protein
MIFSFGYMRDEDGYIHKGDGFKIKSRFYSREIEVKKDGR